MKDRENLLAVLLWLWVALSLGAYLFQYRDMVDPVLRVMGFV